MILISPVVAPRTVTAWASAICASAFLFFGVWTLLSGYQLFVFHFLVAPAAAVGFLLKCSIDDKGDSGGMSLVLSWTLVVAAVLVQMILPEKKGQGSELESFIFASRGYLTFGAATGFSEALVGNRLSPMGSFFRILALSTIGGIVGAVHASMAGFVP